MTPCSVPRNSQECSPNKDLWAVCAERDPEECNPVMKCEEWGEVYPCQPEQKIGCEWIFRQELRACNYWKGICVSANYASPEIVYPCIPSKPEILPGNSSSPTSALGEQKCEPKGDIREACSKAFLPCQKEVVCKRWIPDNYPCDGKKVFGCIEEPYPYTESECAMKGCIWTNNTCVCPAPGPIANPVAECEKDPNCKWVGGECLCTMQSPEQMECEKVSNCAWIDGRCICVMPEPEENMPGPVPNPMQEAMPGPVPNPNA